MQIFRLVEPGIVDRVIGFDELPKRLLAGVRRGGIEGFPRHWRTFFGIEKTADNPKPFYFLEFKILNADKERWQEISNYVRSVTDKEVRLLDKLEDMATPMAPDAYSQMTLEPEDILLIPIPKETSPLVSKLEEGPGEEDEDESEEDETPVVAKRKPGRPKRQSVAA